MNFINPLNYGAKGDGIADDSEIFNNIIDKSNLIIDLQNKTYKCNKTIFIKYDNITIQNGSIDFTDIQQNEPLKTDGIVNWSFAAGFLILGELKNSVKITYGIKNNSDRYNDFVRISKTDLFNNKDYAYLKSDTEYADKLKSGEIIQIDTVDENQWVKNNLNNDVSNNFISEIHLPNTKLDNETQLNFINSTYENYDTSNNSTIGKINFIKNIKFDNLFLFSKKYTIDELNNPIRRYAHRQDWRNEHGLDNKQYLGTAIFIQYGYNILINNCTFNNWYDTGIVLSKSLNCTVNNSIINTIYSNSKGYGVNIRDSSQYITISNSIFTDIRHSVSVGGLYGINRNININSNKILKARDAGIDSHTACQYINITDNFIKCEGSDEEHDGIYLECLDAIITNNIIEGRICNGIRIYPKINYFNSSSYIISKNLISANGDYIFSSGIRIYNPKKLNILDSIIISDNIIKSKLINGIYLSSDDSNVYNVSVNNNIISNNTINGIRISNLNNIKINDNIINSNKINIIVVDSKNINILNNSLNISNSAMQISKSSNLNINLNSINYINLESSNKIFNLKNLDNMHFINNKIFGDSSDNHVKTIFYLEKSSNSIIKNNISKIKEKNDLLITNFHLNENNNVKVIDNFFDTTTKSKYGINLSKNNKLIEIKNNLIKNSQKFINL